MKKLCIFVCAVVLLAFAAGTSTATPILQFNGYTVDDDNSGNSIGNSNGIVDPGETIELYVELINSGDTNALNVQASISTLSSYVTFLFNTSSAYPSPLGVGAVGTNLDDFDFAVDSSAPLGHTIIFDLDITDATGAPWTDQFSIVVGGVSVPEPTTMLLLGFGLIGLAGLRRKV